MKKTLTLFLASVIVCSLLSFGACAEKQPEDNRPVLKVAMECNYQPYNWTQFNSDNGAVSITGNPGQYANGYDVQIAKKIANYLDMKLEIYAREWGSLVSGCESGAFDLIIAGMSPTAERRKKIDFSNPYLTSNLVIVVRKDGAFANATTLEHFAGATICAQEGTFHAQAVLEIANRQGSNMADFPTMLMALKANTIDGYVAEEPGAIADCQGNSELTYVKLINNQTGFTVEDLTNVTIAIGVQKGNTLLTKVNEALATISEETRQELLIEAIENASVLGL